MSDIAIEQTLTKYNGDQNVNDNMAITRSLQMIFTFHIAKFSNLWPINVLIALFTREVLLISLKL